jgi:hypothetical protein
MLNEYCVKHIFEISLVSRDWRACRRSIKAGAASGTIIPKGGRCNVHTCRERWSESIKSWLNYIFILYKSKASRYILIRVHISDNSCLSFVSINVHERIIPSKQYFNIKSFSPEHWLVFSCCLENFRSAKRGWELRCLLSFLTTAPLT